VVVAAEAMSLKIQVLMVVQEGAAAVARLLLEVREILLRLHHHKEVTVAEMALEVR
jgi:hypothetical protein